MPRVTNFIQKWTPSSSRALSRLLWIKLLIIILLCIDCPQLWGQTEEKCNSYAFVVLVYLCCTAYSCELSWISEVFRTFTTESEPPFFSFSKVTIQRKRGELYLLLLLSAVNRTAMRKSFKLYDFSPALPYHYIHSFSSM